MRDKIRVLFLGDIIGRPGRRILSRHLNELRKELQADVIIANAENAAGGVGLTVEVARELLSVVTVLTSGNHIWDKKEGIPSWRVEPRFFDRPTILLAIREEAIIFFYLKMSCP